MSSCPEGVPVSMGSSSDESDYANEAITGTPVDPEASSDQETPKVPDTPSSCVAKEQGVTVSLRSLSD